MRKEKGEGRK